MMTAPKIKTYSPPRWSQESGQPVVIGRKVWLVPPRWQLAHPEGSRGLVYLLTQSGDVCALTEAGEIVVPGVVQQRVRRMHFPQVSFNERARS